MPGRTIGDARKRLAETANPHDFPIRAHDTATGQRALRELAAKARALGEGYAGIAAWIDVEAGMWRSS